MPKGPFWWFRANPQSASVSSVPISSKVGVHSVRGKEARATTVNSPVIIWLGVFVQSSDQILVEAL